MRLGFCMHAMCPWKPNDGFLRYGLFPLELEPQAHQVSFARFIVEWNIRTQQPARLEHCTDATTRNAKSKCASLDKQKTNQQEAIDLPKKQKKNTVRTTSLGRDPVSESTTTTAEVVKNTLPQENAVYSEEWTAKYPPEAG